MKITQMVNNNERTGRTFFDLIADHPKKTFFLVLFLLVGIILLGQSKHLKFGPVEIGDKEIIHDTVIRTIHDTILSTKYITKYKSEPTNNKEVKADVTSYDQKGGQTANQINNN